MHKANPLKNHLQSRSRQKKQSAKSSLKLRRLHSRNIQLNSVKSTSNSSSAECDTSGTCCGGGACGSGVNNTTGVVKKPVCDPYGLDNKPLDIDAVNMQLEFVLENRWSYDTTSNILSRTFQFSKSTRPPLVPAFPGAPSGPCHGPSATVTFLQALNNISVNNDHWAYNVEILPRKPTVKIDLKTVGRAGITYADVNLATNLDVFYSRHMDPSVATV